MNTVRIRSSLSPRLWPLAAGLLALGLALPAVAGDRVGAREGDWDALSPEQQALLAPVAHSWQSLPARQRESLLRRSERLADAPEAARSRFTERLAAWQAMTPEQRRELHRQQRRFHEMPAGKRERMQARWQAFSELPEAEQAALRDRHRRWKAMSEAERSELRECHRALRRGEAVECALPPPPPLLPPGEHRPGLHRGPPPAR